jgi:hypothetical protein
LSRRITARRPPDHDRGVGAGALRAQPVGQHTAKNEIHGGLAGHRIDVRAISDLFGKRGRRGPMNFIVAGSGRLRKMCCMAESKRELLVVSTGDANPAEVVSHAGGRVTQRLAERIALALVPDGAQDALASRRDVTVYAEDIPDDVLATLREDERVFVDAWRERGKAKKRTGEGQSWDAPGFQAP